MAFVNNIENLTENNNYFRRVINTSKYSQLVLMSLKPLEDIGLEKHKADQFFRIEKGHGIAIIGKKMYKIKSGDGIVVPSGTYHNIINLSKKKKLKFYTIYSPAQHKPNTINKNKP